MGYHFGVAMDTVRAQAQQKEAVKRENVLHAEKEDLIGELSKLKDKSDALFAEDRKRLEDQVNDDVVVTTMAQRKVQEVEQKLEVAGKKIEDMKREKVQFEQKVDSLTQKNIEFVEGLKIAKNYF